MSQIPQIRTPAAAAPFLAQHHPPHPERHPERPHGPERARGAEPLGRHAKHGRRGLGPSADPDHRFSPAECIDCERHTITGSPVREDISTSYVERQNRQVRMRNRRFTRLTGGFSKKLENLEHSVALHFFAYNFLTRHGTLRMPPALKAGVADHWWTYEELVELIDRETG